MADSAIQITCLDFVKTMIETNSVINITVVNKDFKFVFENSYTNALEDTKVKSAAKLKQDKKRMAEYVKKRDNDVKESLGKDDIKENDKSNQKIKPEADTEDITLEKTTQNLSVSNKCDKCEFKASQKCSSENS